VPVMVLSGRTRSKATYIYKRVGDLSIEADVYRPAGSRRCPVVVWIHGGALINGYRDSVPEWLLGACQESGFTLVSVDYRLAPETQLLEIVRDIEDFFRWVRAQGPQRFGAIPELIAVVGESAGGYLALTAGFRVLPRLSAVVSLWGYGDLIGSWYSQPSPHECHHQMKLSPDEAYRRYRAPRSPTAAAATETARPSTSSAGNRVSGPRRFRGGILSEKATSSRR
jgi:dipeptidyl aminopeptidase/acylaminoacyl peptidase